MKYKRHSVGLREFSTVMFISDYKSKLSAIENIFPLCPILYDRLCGQHVFIAKQKR